MLNEKNLLSLERDLLQQTNDFLNNYFNFFYTLDYPVFHYTKKQNSAAIIKDQSLQASMIRNTSDPLEYALPLSAARDWTCINNNLFNFSNFPIELFKHFNQQSVDPHPRYYFVSFSRESNLNHLKSMYGDSVVKIESIGNNERFKDYGQWIKCKYVDDPKKEIFTILNIWKKSVFYPNIEKYIESPKIDAASPEVINYWFYIFMKVCLTIPLAIKQNAFSEEKEFRLILIPEDPDTSNLWMNPRSFQKLPYLREYISLKLSSMNLKATIS